MRHGRVNMARGMMRAIAGAVLLSLAACSGGGGSAGTPVPAEGPQTGLERVPLTITMGSTVHRFTVEVAASEEQQEHGMMFRTSVGADEGMVFPFDPPKYASFWMKNTLIPLDLLFVRADGTIDRIAENAVPESLEPIGSGGEVAAVLELAGGTAARLGIDETGVVHWQGDNLRPARR